MEISVLSKFLLRLAKDYGYHQEMYKNDKLKISLYDVNLVSLIELSKRKECYKNFLKIVDDLFDINHYMENTLANKKDFVIVDIKNYDKLCKYLDSNGFMWGSGKRCVKYKPISCEHINSDLYIKLYLDETRMYYGHRYSKESKSTIFSENEFYSYYENYKRNLNKVFYECVKKNYGVFKKK
jgi:hypothetical protein